jgi:exodeoxyribonuclease VII large subunit
MGHIYFSLKDESGSMPCVMFKGSQPAGLDFRLEDGQAVVIEGQIRIYPKDARINLYAKKIRLDGDGAGKLHVLYEQLKQKLFEEGLFDFEKKKEIPKYPKKVGIVTASTGAAIQDICNIARRRNPYVELVLYTAKVQGEGAAATIARGIRTLDGMGMDTIIIGRGGGSIEDLWAFNEEIVARAIFDCQTPVISAVGHETDTTIADYVADLRAPTPSAAAELAVCDVREILHNLRRYRDRFSSEMTRAIERKEAAYREKYAGIRALRPSSRIREKRLRLDALEDGLRKQQERILADNQYRWNAAFVSLRDGRNRTLAEKKHRLELLIGRMEGASPLKKLCRGFSYVETEEGRNVSSVAQVSAGDCLQIQVADGTIRAEVTGTQEKERENVG